MTTCHGGEATPTTPIMITRHEEFWISVIRQASRDSDPPPTLNRVQKLRALFRERWPDCRRAGHAG
jgi:hypothetical protein